MSKLCKICREPNQNPMAQVCSIPCSIEYTRKQREKAQEKRRAEFRRETRQRKEKLKTRGDWLKEAQREFNRFIRLRDKDKPCISCDRVEVEWTRGGQWDCGHFRSVGAAPELRFEEKNAHKQCKSCNGGSGKYTRKNYTVGMEYEERLRARIGDENVDWLLGPHEPKHYTIEDIKAIKAKYRQKCKEIES